MLLTLPMYMDRFNEFVMQAKHLQTICEAGNKITPSFINVVGDIWQCFYIETFEFIDYEFNPQLQYLKQLIEMEEYKNWHHFTKNDLLLSILTTIQFAEYLLGYMKSNDAIRKAAITRQIIERKIARAEENIDNLNVENVSQFERDCQRFYNNAHQKTLKAARQEHVEIDNQILQAIHGFKQQAKTILKASNEEIKIKQHAIKQLATVDGRKWQNIPLKDQLQYAEAMTKNPSVLKIANLAGRFKKVAIKKMKTKHRTTMERNAITIGNELERLLPMEYMNFLHQTSHLDFLVRYAEGQTLTYDKKGKDRKGKGPIIVCMDESSSMYALKEQSKAFCFAMLLVAKKQKRDFAIIPFSTNLGEIHYFFKGKILPEQLVSFSEQFLGGGTNYEKPLRQSLNILSESRFNAADILFVTDCSSFLSSQFIEEFNSCKQKRKFECISIVLTNLVNTIDLNVVQKFSDRVIEVNDLFEAEDVFLL